MINLNDYDFQLPKELIAQQPAEPRDHSRLFIYDTRNDSVRFDYFYNLDEYLPSNALMVMNETKVVPSRVTMYKESGGKAEILFLVNELTDSADICGLSDRKITVGQKLYFQQDSQASFVTISRQEGNRFYFSLPFNKEKLIDLLNNYGTMPIPLYLRNTPLKRKELLEKYQTIFARNEGSAAAPTASLHFTKGIFNKLEQKKIDIIYLTLHVGMGTFASIGQDEIKSGQLHNEFYYIGKSAKNELFRAKSDTRAVIAVGTTTVRALESDENTSGSRIVNSEYKHTNLFIKPGYRFKYIDTLITNFHLPKSSLMLLVDAFLQHKKAHKNIVDLYKVAVQEKFRFYSFGDAMLIL